MSEEYAMSWMVKRYGDDIGTWPLGMVKKCAEMMAVYQTEMMEFKLKQIAKEQAEKAGNATVTPAPQPNDAKLSDTTSTKRTVIAGG